MFSLWKVAAVLRMILPRSYTGNLLQRMAHLYWSHIHWLLVSSGNTDNVMVLLSCAAAWVNIMTSLSFYVLYMYHRLIDTNEFEDISSKSRQDMMQWRRSSKYFNLSMLIMLCRARVHGDLESRCEPGTRDH